MRFGNLALGIWRFGMDSSSCMTSLGGLKASNEEKHWSIFANHLFASIDLPHETLQTAFVQQGAVFCPPLIWFR